MQVPSVHEKVIITRQMEIEKKKKKKIEDRKRTESHLAGA